MAGLICPWWLGYALVNPVRRLWQDPAVILRPFVSKGMLVLEPGCGMGFFTLDLARLVGPGGRVIAVDIQEKMLSGLRRRAGRAGLADRIETRLAVTGDFMTGDLTGRVDFALAFAVVHELPDPNRFYLEMRRALRPGGKLLVAEPKGHVRLGEFRASMASTSQFGFLMSDGPAIRGSWTAVLQTAEQ